MRWPWRRAGELDRVLEGLEGQRHRLPGGRRELAGEGADRLHLDVEGRGHVHDEGGRDARSSPSWSPRRRACAGGRRRRGRADSCAGRPRTTPGRRGGWPRRGRDGAAASAAGSRSPAAAGASRPRSTSRCSIDEALEGRVREVEALAVRDPEDARGLRSPPPPASPASRGCRIRRASDRRGPRAGRPRSRGPACRP